MKEESGEGCVRCRINLLGENAYVTVGDKFVMCSFANEAGYQNKDLKALINLTCRMTSKARAAGVPWSVVLKQFRSVNVGHSVVSDAMVTAIEEYIQRVAK